MIGTATSKLFAFSRAACPPRLNRPTLYPVLPRFRVGIADCVFGLTGTSDIAWPTDARAGIAACVSRPAATAPPLLPSPRAQGSSAAAGISCSSAATPPHHPQHDCVVSCPEPAESRTQSYEP